MLPQLIKKFENIFGHIYLKVIIVIVALVLPLNIISVLQSRGTEEAMLEQARLSTDNLADNYMNEINARMENTQSLLSQLLREDIHCIRMRKPEIEEYAYQNERMLFFYNLKTIGNMINGADGYFYYMEKNEDLIIWGKHVTGELIQKTMEDYLLQELERKKSKGWYIQRLNGKDYAFLIVYGKDIVYGGWINLNSVLEQIEHGIEYENPVLTFYEERPESSEKNMVNVFSERRGIGLHIQIQKKKITARISIYQKIQQYLVLIYLILIPVMYIFLSIPASLQEAARIDGASEFKIFVSIVLPLSKPIIATVGLMTALAYWNDWMNGLYYLTERGGSQLYTIQNILNNINDNIQVLLQNASQAAAMGASVADMPSTTVRMAIAVVGILPILILYPFFQRYFVKGITLGGVKE